MSNSSEIKAHEERMTMITTSFKDPEIPKIYANGFIVSFGNADVSVLLQRNGVPVAALNLSYTLAKTFGEKVLKMVKFLENKTENEIMTTEFIDLKLQRREEKTETEST